MSKMNEISFTDQEKEELFAKARTKFLENDVEKVLVFGSSNITYLAPGMVFPYLDQKVVYPVALYICYKTNRRIISCTSDLADIPKQLNWDGDVVVYELTHQTAEASLASALGPYIEGRVAIDENYTTGAQLNALKDEIVQLELDRADDIINELKLNKTEAEVRLLEIACRMGDRGFVSALNHTEGAALDALSYPLWEYAERFRVHAGEYGGSGVGNISVLQGKGGTYLYGPCAPRGTFNPDEFIRLEYSMHNHGYWITGSRTVYVGSSNEAAEATWADNQTLKSVALDMLQVGRAASDIYAAVVKASEDKNIPFWQDIDIGHGVGTSEREAPFLTPFDNTVIEAGMVIALGVYTYGPDDELICNKDVYLIADDGPKLLTWYKNWDDLYVMYGTSARHG